MNWLDILIACGPALSLFVAWRVACYIERDPLEHRRPTPTVREQQQRRAWLAQQDEYHPFPWPK